MVPGSIASSGPSITRSCTTVGTCTSVPSSGSYSIAKEGPESAIRMAATRDVLGICIAIPLTSAGVRSFDRVDLGGAIRDLVDRERLGLLAEHAGRACGHARQRDALDRRLLRQQADDRAHRHVALDHIALDQRGMAAF